MGLIFRGKGRDLGGNKLPYKVESNTFDPQILNFTLKAMQRSIDEHAKHTSEKFIELQAEIRIMRKENSIKNEKINRVDKDFNICKASKGGENNTNKSRNALLFQILTIMTAAGALFLGACSYFKKGGG